MIKRLISFTTSILLLLALVFVLLNFRTLRDWVAFYETPKGSVAETYSQKLELTQAGKLIFYGTFPQIDSKVQFNVDCKPGQNILEFGCYWGGVNRIYLLDIQEPKLKTMVDVGAAHELLHAVYGRMSEDEKAKINQLLEADYAKLKNPDLEARLKSYALTEPGNRDNELHSILATEDAKLSPELEKHYGLYFKNRGKIVGWFLANETYIKNKEAGLKVERKKIETADQALRALDARMLKLKKSNQIKAYNALVPIQNRMVDNLKAQVDKYNTDVARYNDIIASINSHTYSSFDKTQIK